MITISTLTLRVADISLVRGREYAKEAAKQRMFDSSDTRFRATIADRNMIPYALSSDERYTNPPYATHAIGYINDGVGVSGIEKGLDGEISAKGEVIPRLKDGAGNDIRFFRKNEPEKEERTLKLTLDYHIQKIAESVLDEENINGAAVVMDIESFDVLAMASRPNYSRDDIDKYIESNGTELLNRAVAPYNAGSIFKIVTASAAIEDGFATEDDMHYCGGRMYADGIEFVCHKEEGHREISFAEAFAQSCNCAFYKVGGRLGSRRICQFAEKFNMGKPLLNGVIYENGGNVPKHLVLSDSEASNLSIGQGEILITPLQSAQIVSIVAGGGIAKEVNLADAIVSKEGRIIKDLRKRGEKRVISNKTAERIRAMMLCATEEGTGSNALSAKVKIAGKTGSAETGWKVDDEYMVQGWFVGFFPYDNPTYALSVMCENGRGGNFSCGPAFRKMAERIMELKNS